MARKISVICIVLLFIALAAASLVHIDVSTQADGVIFYGNYIFGDPYAASGDKVIYFSLQDQTNTSSTIAVIAQVDANGRFTEVVRESVNVRTSQVFTNGNWWGVLRGNGTILWKLDASNNIVNKTSFDTMGSTYYLKMLSDDTIVAQVASQIVTYTLQSGVWTASSNVIPYPAYNTGGIYAIDNYMVTVNETGTIMIYTRTTGDWSFSESLETNLTVPNAPTYIFHNGVDTVFICHAVTPYAGGLGILETFTKVNGEWKHQVLTNADLGLSAMSYIGYDSGVIVDKDNFLVGAAYDGYSQKRGGTKYGSGLLMQRQPDNTWTRTVNFTTQDNGLFASTSLVVNNYFAFVTCQPSTVPECRFYTTPSCIAKPFVATCTNINIDSCAVDLSALPALPYTLNDCSTAPNVTVNVTGTSRQNNVITVSLSFERQLATPYTCNGTLTCSAGSPQSGPGSNTPSKKTSAAPVTSFVGVAVVVALAALF